MKMIEYQANSVRKIIVIITITSSICICIIIISLITIMEEKMTGITWFFVLGHNVARLKGKTSQTDDDDEDDDYDDDIV